MDYDLKRMIAYQGLGRDEDYKDVIISVLASLVLDKPIRDEDRQFLTAYLKIKEDIPKEEIVSTRTFIEIPKEGEDNG